MTNERMSAGQRRTSWLIRPRCSRAGEDLGAAISVAEDGRRAAGGPGPPDVGDQGYWPSSRHGDCQIWQAADSSDTLQQVTPLGLRSRKGNPLGRADLPVARAV